MESTLNFCTNLLCWKKSLRGVPLLALLPIFVISVNSAVILKLPQPCWLFGCSGGITYHDSISLRVIEYLLILRTPQSSSGPLFSPCSRACCSGMNDTASSFQERIWLLKQQSLCFKTVLPSRPDFWRAASWTGSSEKYGWRCCGLCAVQPAACYTGRHSQLA